MVHCSCLDNPVHGLPQDSCIEVSVVGGYGHVWPLGTYLIGAVHSLEPSRTPRADILTYVYICLFNTCMILLYHMWVLDCYTVIFLYIVILLILVSKVLYIVVSYH